MNTFLNIFSPQGLCSRRAFWWRQPALQLGFSAASVLYAGCLAFVAPGDEGAIWFFHALFFLISFPCGLLTLLFWVAVSVGLLLLFPPGYTLPVAAEGAEPLLVAGMLLGVIAMLAFCARSWALAARRLRESGLCLSWLLLPCIPVVGHIALTLLLCSPARGAGEAPPSSPAES